MKNRFKIEGDIATIYIPYLDQVLETIIDTKDLPVAQSFIGTWRAFSTRPGKYYIGGGIFFRRNGNIPGHTKQFTLARLLMGFPEELVVDHINDNSLDNRRSVNLQAITSSENVKKQIKKRGKGVYRTVRRRAGELGLGHLYDL
ncbi:hypothetical protein B1748_23640 [Paenibacillus sp. MY03]|uniref:HNH endonuclease n=1 Tax=Paenibacillus sp. MY03 TaxID=302980 RepID=UPI000B3C3D03|nr:HNH endonuclease [Paenibacillus sp. MY03]OUS73004.1 hypothetical protein B1748_23640 [Paenibacillus sp. MY03]